MTVAGHSYEYDVRRRHQLHWHLYSTWCFT